MINNTVRLIIGASPLAPGGDLPTVSRRHDQTLVPAQTESLR